MLLQPTPLGFCQCGCGKPAGIAPLTNRRLGVRKGQPNRYLHGHHSRFTAHCQTLRPRADFGVVPVFRGGGAIAYALIDASDWELAVGYRWRLSRYGYARATDDAGRDILLHRLVMGYTHGDGLQADHINRDRLDNRKANLRPATSAQQAQNRGTYGTSKHRGVCWAKDTQRWQAQVKVNGRQYYLGQYDDELEAARVASEFRTQHMPYSEDARRVA